MIMPVGLENERNTERGREKGCKSAEMLGCGDGLTIPRLQRTHSMGSYCNSPSTLQAQNTTKPGSVLYGVFLNVACLQC